MGFLQRFALDAAEGEDFCHARVFDKVAVKVDGLDRRVFLDRTRQHAPRQKAAEVGVVLDKGDEHGEGLAFVHRGRRHVVDHEVEKGRKVLALVFQRQRGPALTARGPEDGEVELFVGRVQRGEKIEDLLVHHFGLRVGAVDLVDEDDGADAELERLAQHELGLRQRAFGGIAQHDGAVHHGKDAFHLGAEIGVAGGVDDVDAGVLPHDRGHLGKDGDAALALEVVGVHHAFGDLLVLAELAGLLQKGVDKGGFAVVDVRDNRDVSEFRGHSIAA